MTGILTTQPVGLLGGGSFGLRMYDLSGQGVGPYYNVQMVANSTGTGVINPATDDSLQQIRALLAEPLTVTWGAGTTVPVSLATLPASAASAALQTAANTALGVLHSDLQGTLEVNAAALPLPAGAATDAKLNAILAAITAQIDLSTSIWTDGNGNYYVRRESVVETTGAISISFTNPDGSAASVSAGALQPVAAADALVPLTNYFDVTAVGTGTSVGDIVARAVIVNKAATPPTASAAIWINLTQGTTLAMPPAANAIAEQTQHIAIASLPLPPGAATDAGVQGVTTALGPIGTKADAAATAASTSGSVVAWLRGLLVAFGSTTDAAYVAGSGSTIAILKGIFGAVTGTLKTAPQSNAQRASATGSLQNSGDSVVLAVDGFSALGLQLASNIAWTGTVSFFGSQDGGASYPFPLSMATLGSSAPDVVAATANGNWEKEAGALTHIKVVGTTAIAGGPVTATLIATTGVKRVKVSGSSASPLPVNPGVGSPVEASMVLTSLTGLNLLSTQPASARIGLWFCQNQSASVLTIALDDGANGSLSIFLLSPGGGADQQGGSMGSADTGPHQGRIRVYGPAASSHALRVQ